MKKRGKILFAIIMLGAILINLSISVSAHSLDTKEIIISEDSPERHNGVELTWESGEMYNQLCTVENSEMAVRYIYDNEGRRIGKTGEKSI